MGHHPRELASLEATSLKPPQSVRAEWLPLAALTAHVSAWEDLARRALEPNVFYEPAFALPAAAVFGRGAGAVLVWSTREQLIGLFPARIERRRYGFAPAVLVGWTHPYAPLGVPLVDRDEAFAAITTWLDYVTREAGMPNLILFPYIGVERPFATALRDVIAARDGQSACFGAHARALLAPQDERGEYLQRALSAKKRKELGRQRRRLGDHAQVEVRIADRPPDISAALAAFMALEARGWKGSAGTAAANNPAIHDFMQRALGALAERSQAHIAQLLLDERPIAAAIVLRSGAAGWFWKVTYDEEAARASPGVQLALDLTRAILSDAALSQVDSCATPDHPMIDHLWRERLALADLLIAADADAASTFALVRRLEAARRRVIDCAKWARTRLRRD
ncbi:MAG TPA: GNAT family N-acetyltransferase [Xanthobacteraceae bacterium]|nr:GNAT family N-acetyltransferase [Xanthobacteraceae bacterium]